MIKMKSLIATSIILTLTACGGGGGEEEIGSSAQSVGTLKIVGSDFFAGAPLSVSLTDTDGVVDGTVTYSWVRNPDGTTVDLSTTSSYTLTEEDEGSIIQVTALYNTNSGLFKSENVLTSEIRPTLDVSAFAIKGPIDSATCDIFEVDENGTAGAIAQASSTSDITGAVTFTGVHFTGNGLISCAGGTYTDESTGNTLTAPTLRAVVDVVEDGTTTQDEEGNDVPVIAPDYIVSPLTELAVQAAGNNLATTPEEAELINARFSIRFDTTETYPTVIGVDTLGVNGAENADTYGAVLALISQLNADDTDNDLGTILAELATDLSDGEFSTDTQIAFEIAQTNLETISVISTLIDSDLFNTISAAISNDPIPATFEGELSGTINSSSTVALTGKVTVNDINFEEDSIIAQTDIATTYGTFSIDADGNWSYFVNTSNTTVAALELGDSVSELITIASIDGTTTVIDIKVAALTQLAQISDTGTDTGEIRFDVNNLRQGKLSATILKDETSGNDGNIKDAYITLYGSSGSSSEALIDLRIQGNAPQDDGTIRAPRFLVRNTDSDAYTGGIITAPFVEQQFYNIDISWDLDATEQVTVSIDGAVIGGGAFSTAAVLDSDFINLDQWFADGVQTIQFRLGDNDRTIPFGSYFVDNIAVYSDTAGTVNVFQDDFESYTEGDTLATAESLYSLAIYSEVVAFIATDPNAARSARFEELEGGIDSDTAIATGQVNVFDSADEAFITAATFTGTYGTLVITEDGSWTYTLDLTHAEIAPLEVGQRKTETFTISSVDGTEADLVITISGTIAGTNGGPGTDGNKFAAIADTLTNDTGELRYRFGTEQTSGSISFSFKKDVTSKNTAADSTGTKNASITLYGDSTSSSNEVLQLEVKSSTITIDDTDTGAGDTTFATTFTPATEWVDVLIEWDTTNVIVDGGVSFTITINGTDIEQVISPLGNGFNIRNVQFRLGSESDTNIGNFSIDDLIIIGADGTEILNDNFEAFVVGDVLGAPGDAYHTNSSEATVAEE